MKKKVQSLRYLGAVILFLSIAVSLHAQTSQSQPQEPQSQQPAPAQPDRTPDPSQPPDSQAQSSQTAGAQSFTGTIVKSGDKYVFQDAATGNTYDIDHQDEVQKFEGKRVKIHGTLDASGKVIHIQ